MTSSLADRDAARPDDDGSPVSPPQQSEPADVRLAWAPSASPPSGTWWPRSRDAADEIRALLPQVTGRLGGFVTRVSLNMDAWDADQPRRLRVDDRLVRLGWFHTLDPTTVTLARGSDPRVTLHIVPPELNPEEARQLMHAAATGSP